MNCQVNLAKNYNHYNFSNLSFYFSPELCIFVKTKNDSDKYFLDIYKGIEKKSRKVVLRKDVPTYRVL